MKDKVPSSSRGVRALGSIVGPRKVRCLAVIAGVLMSIAATSASGKSPGPEVFVTAKLKALDRNADCGIALFGSDATYDVIEGPGELVGRQIHVMVDCVELPRSGGLEDYGDLKSFEVGAVHFLAITRENIRRIESPSTLPESGLWFYLRAASLNVLRPDTSLERARGK